MKRHILEQNYPRLLASAGIDAEQVLRKAGVAEDTFTHHPPTMTTSDYFAFLTAIGKLCPPGSAVQLASATGIEQFSPPVFASYCARNGRVCIERLKQYKRIIGPLEFHTTGTTKQMSIELVCEGYELPSFLVECEFVFLVNLLRTATGEHITPTSVQLHQLDVDRAVVDFLGCLPQVGPSNVIAFATRDMELPFISHNDSMWSYFEPELQRRLAELDADDSYTTRVQSALMEMLPGGETGIDDVAHRLGMSKRTLQRKLGAEKTTFQAQLKHTRQLLAQHYLTTTSMKVDEIAYLLGYIELNSFLRAFYTWLGMSPREYRARHAVDEQSLQPPTPPTPP